MYSLCKYVSNCNKEIAELTVFILSKCNTCFVAGVKDKHEDWKAVMEETLKSVPHAPSYLLDSVSTCIATCLYG